MSQNEEERPEKFSYIKRWPHIQSTSKYDKDVRCRLEDVLEDELHAETDYRTLQIYLETRDTTIIECQETLDFEGLKRLADRNDVRRVHAKI